jgi:hypothetical protein
MYLDNGWCQLLSEPLYYDLSHCYTPPPPFRFGNGAGDEGAAANLLEAAPNPAGSYAMAQFRVLPGSNSRSLTVTDMTGRVLQQHALDTEQGSIRLSLDGYAAGLYQLTLRRDGAVVQTLKLVVGKQ